MDESRALEYSLRWLHLCFTPADYRFDSGFADKHEPSPVEYGIQPVIYDRLFTDERAALVRPRGDKSTVLCTFGTVFNKNLAALPTLDVAVRLLERLADTRLPLA